MIENIKILKKLLNRNVPIDDYKLEYYEVQAIIDVVDRLEQLEKENKELKEKMGKAYKHITDEMYIDDNPTMCGDEWEDTITELPISLHLYNEDLRELLDLLD